MSSDSPLEISDRQQQMLRANGFYNGNPRKPLTIRNGDVDDNLLIAPGRLIVDKGVSFLFGKDAEAQVTSSDGEQQQAWLDACWQKNKRGITLQKLAINGGIFGHAFIRLLDQKPFPRVIILDPTIVNVVTDPDDIDTVWQYTITPPATVPPGEEKPVPRRTVIENPNGQHGENIGLDLPWYISDQEQRGSAWITTATQEWPYDFPPVHGCQNLPKPNDYWGEADLPEDVLHVLEGINRIASHINTIIRIHAGPKVWTRGMGSAKIDLSTKVITHLPAETAEMKVLEMQSDLTASREFLDKLLSLLSYMVRIPMVAMGEPDGLGAVSGVSLQIRYQPLLEKTESKRLLYGDLLEEVDRCLLSMNGFEPVAPTQLQWPEIMPSDPLQERQVWVLDESLGLVSKETLSTLADLDFPKEQARIKKEHAADVASGLAAPPLSSPEGVMPAGAEVAPPTAAPKRG